MMHSDFYEQLSRLEITHHRPRVIRHYLNAVLFRDVSLEAKRVLDVGGGRGLCSYFAAFKGATSVHNVEPLLSGSEQASIAAFAGAQSSLGTTGAVLVNRSIQDHLTECGVYDVIILHDSINHLDESNYSRLHQDPSALHEYIELLKRLADRHSAGGTLVVTDCARRNFFGDLGFRSPFAPSINWNLHQDPRLLAHIVRAAGYVDVHWKWTPLKRAGLLGRLLAKLGRIPSYFLQSHFVLFARKGLA